MADPAPVLPLLRWATLGVWAAWLATYWLGGLRMRMHAGRPLVRGSAALDLALIAAVVGVAQVSVWTGIFASLGRVSLLPWASLLPVGLIGAGLTLTGAAGTFYGRRRLGDLWAAGTALISGHAVIDSGPYRLVRHPIYAATLIMNLGTVVVFPTWWTALAFGLLAAAHVVRVLKEEDFLAENLPGYHAYRERVAYRLLPGVW